MGALRRALPVKLFVGMLCADEDIMRRARHLLARRFGAVELESEVWPFTFSNYYQAEMGAGLLRWFIAFERCIQPDEIGEIKEWTNALEEQITADAMSVTGRAINLDPGYVDLGKLVLATTKDRAHRICVGPTTYAEVTLQFVGGQWRAAPWTYPDFQSQPYQEYFTCVRNSLKQQRDALFADPGAHGPGA